MDSTLRESFTNDLKKCYEGLCADGREWRERYYLPNPPAGFDRANYPIEALNVSYPLKTSQINEQTRKYKTHLKELKSEPNWDNNKVARYAWHYCAINYINQLGRIIPYDITGCIDILKCIHEFLRLILRSTDHEYQALREMDNKVRAEISRIEKLEQDLCNMSVSMT